jgi:alpha-mannosidase
MIREILFVHHSHTDIGYTHPQPVVFELHRRFIDEALDIADRTADWPDDSRFRWTCEVTGITQDWWTHANDRDRERFLAAVQRGQFDVAAMAWHMTPLMDHGMLVDTLKPIRFFRDLGIPVRAAMNTDVNGLPWGVVDALLDHGIEGLSMAINEHFGHALRPWPRAFRWQAPGGRTMLAYNGFIYGVTSDRMLRIPLDMEEARVRVPRWTKLWEDRGYPHPFLMMQITNVRYHDNGSPQPALPAFVRAWNETNPEIRLRIGTLSEFFDRLGAEPEDRLPVLRGDWTDWWNFGAGSTAHETSQAMEGQRHLDDALGLEAWRPTVNGRQLTLFDDTRRALALYAEHTWGADRSVSRPQSAETRSQQLLKLALAPQGASLARMLRRDGLERLAESAGGEAPRLLVYNPHPFPVRRSLRLPYLPPLAGAPEPSGGFGLEAIVPTGPQSHRVQRQDVLLSDLSDENAYWSAPIDVPALSYLTLPAEAVRPAGGDCEASDGFLSNGRVRVAFDKIRGGVRSFKLDDVEYAGAVDGAAMGVPVLERPEAATRNAIFDKIDVESPDWNESWHTDWIARRDVPEGVLSSRALVERGRAEVEQAFALPGGDRIRVIYRVVPDEAALEVEVIVAKTPLADPHAIYLPFPTNLGASWRCDFETAGAAVALDAEQLPYASRHYITTQRWIRLTDGERELTIACPDAPLWQVGGFTFGRHQDPDGRVSRERPMLVAWLTNNYWMTNFQADQGGALRFRFWLLPRPARPLGASAAEALAYARPPAVHVYAGRGEIRRTAETLLKLDLGNLLLTRLEPADGGVALTLLNPDETPVEVTIGPGTLMPVRARRTSLAGDAVEDLPCRNGEVRVVVASRAWRRITVEVDRLR